MRKTILMLLNGFGVERKDSTEVYSSKLMPNLDAMTKSYLFGSLVADAGDYNNGYRLFSMPQVNKKQDDEIDNLIYDKKLDKNEVLQTLKNTLTTENKLHIFYIVQDDFKFNQVKEFIKAINPDKNKKVFMHLIMTGTSTANYAAIKNIISKISFEFSSYCKIGFVVGKNKINTDDVLRAFYRELGEHWNESTKKIDILEKDIINPENAGVFIINGGFALQENDVALFANYDTVEMDRFYGDFTKMPMTLFSIFEFKDGVANMFSKNKGTSAFTAAILEEHNIKLLVLTTSEHVNDINFYLNGMEKKLCPNINYAVNNINLFNSKESVVELMKNNFDGLIIDYNIGNFNRLEDIKQTLANADSVIKNISDAAKEQNYTFIVSSLYGMHAPVTEKVVQKVVNFAGKVPCIFQSNEFPLSDYVLNGSTTYGLALTYFTNICDEVKANKLIHKKSGLEKMLAKK